MKREVGVTDELLSELEEFRTCTTCRNKLKQYRKKHVLKKRKNTDEEQYKEDDEEKVLVITNADKKIKSSHPYLLRKQVEFDLILKKIHDMAENEDVNVDETCKIDEFTIPQPSIKKSISAIPGLEENIFSDDGDRYIGQANIERDPNHSSSGVSSNLVCKQTEKDESFKSELIKSLEIHYINRIKHVLEICGYDFRFYVSSWKNGKYYVSFRCFDDKEAMKRFGIDDEKTAATATSVKLDHNEVGGYEANQISVLKSKVLGWVDPKDSGSVNLNLNVENEPVNSHFQTSIGYFCASKLNFIVDYMKLEFRVKFTHKFHRSELKVLKENNKWTKVHESNDRNKGIENKKPNHFERERNDPARLAEKLDKLHKVLNP